MERGCTATVVASLVKVGKENRREKAHRSGGGRVAVLERKPGEVEQEGERSASVATPGCLLDHRGKLATSAESRPLQRRRSRCSRASTPFSAPHPALRRIFEKQVTTPSTIVRLGISLARNGWKG